MFSGVGRQDAAPSLGGAGPELRAQHCAFLHPRAGWTLGLHAASYSRVAEKQPCKL